MVGVRKRNPDFPWLEIVVVVNYQDASQLVGYYNLKDLYFLSKSNNIAIKGNFDKPQRDRTGVDEVTRFD